MALNVGDLGNIDIFAILNLPAHELGCLSIYLDPDFLLGTFYDSSMEVFHHLVKFPPGILFC